MSVQNVIDENNLPTSKLVADILISESIKVLKYHRYDIGNICHEKMRSTLRMERLHCSEYCYLDKDDGQRIRAKIIRDGITKIKEL